MRAATLESRLEELGVLRSFSRPRVSNDNPYSESLFRTVKYRPDYPRRPFRSVEEACAWVAASDSLRHPSATAEKPLRSGGTVSESMSRRDNVIPAAGVGPRAAGVSRRWSGSIRRHQKTASLRLHYRWLPDRRQGHHLSWQSPNQAECAALFALIVDRNSGLLRIDYRRGACC